ncbi:MAG: hypothetical protein ACPGOV_14835 [Magnetovibrionaceae bacterium]
MIITLPAVAIAWFMRLCSRFIFHSLEGKADAERRALMADTYLALKNEEGSELDEKERFLILNALFRPPGAKSDDDAPPPNLLEILTAKPKG